MYRSFRACAPESAIFARSPDSSSASMRSGSPAGPVVVATARPDREQQPPAAEQRESGHEDPACDVEGVAGNRVHRAVGRGVGSNQRAVADDERHRAGDGVRVCRDDAVAQRVGTVAEAVLQIQGRGGDRQVKNNDACLVTSGAMMDGSALVLVGDDR